MTTMHNCREKICTPKDLHSPSAVAIKRKESPLWTLCGMPNQPRWSNMLSGDVCDSSFVHRWRSLRLIRSFTYRDWLTQTTHRHIDVMIINSRRINMAINIGIGMATEIKRLDCIERIFEKRFQRSHRYGIFLIILVEMKCDSKYNIEFFFLEFFEAPK